MSREVRWALAAVGSVLLLAGFVLGVIPLETSYQLGGMNRAATTACGSAFTGSDDPLCIDTVSSRLTLSIVLMVVGAAVLAAWGAVAFRSQNTTT